MSSAPYHALRFALPLLGTALLPGVLHAAVAEGRLGTVRYRILVPDWIRAGERINVLCVIETEGGVSAGEAVELALESASRHLRPGEGSATARTVTVLPGAVRRVALSGIEARESGTARLALRLQAGSGGIRGKDVSEGAEKALEFKIQVLRAALLPEGPWSILAPVAMSCLLLPLFLAILRKDGRPGFWTRVEEVAVNPAEEPWWRTAS